jgi:hypothetical protein
MLVPQLFEVAAQARVSVYHKHVYQKWKELEASGWKPAGFR